MEEIGIGEKVIMGREFIHKHGQPVMTEFTVTACTGTHHTALKEMLA